MCWFICDFPFIFNLCFEAIRASFLFIKEKTLAVYEDLKGEADCLQLRLVQIVVHGVALRTSASSMMISLLRSWRQVEARRQQGHLPLVKNMKLGKNVMLWIVHTFNFNENGLIKIKCLPRPISRRKHEPQGLGLQN